MSDNVWAEGIRIGVTLTAAVHKWLMDFCQEGCYVEVYGNADKFGILVFARSADALAFSLAFPSQNVKYEV